MDSALQRDARMNIAVNQVNMREVIMHAQPSSGSMHLIFGSYVRPNGACLSRLLHIVDNFICVC